MDGTPVKLDSILQSVLGRWAKSFGMSAVVLRGNGIVAQGVAGVRRRGAGPPAMCHKRLHQTPIANSVFIKAFVHGGMVT